jgi:tetratricopeptide (TPR) repeat protein
VQQIHYQEPQVVQATPLDLELFGKNDEELFAVGRAAFAAGDYSRAASAFGRIADLYPDSKRHAAALFDAGLSHRARGEWRAALERFRAMENGYTGPDADEAAFRAAECHYNLRQLAEARAALDRLAQREDLEVGERVRALDQRGIVELEMGDPEAAERSLRAALSTFGESQEQERLDDHYAAEAQFYLGEVYRRHFEAVALDPSRSGQDQLAEAMERKCQLLITAQGHYLRVLRTRDAEAVVAAGYRVGELYDELVRQLLEAPLPPGLDAEQQAAYRGLLRQRVRVPVEKAIRNYEDTLTIAQRAGVAGRFVERTQASLDRMKQALADTGPPGS